jgi:phosphopantothenoylcysteine synthetase/decarboxylase
VVVTAGPTLEDIDPVRFLGNRSSGRMGFALAAEASRRGGDGHSHFRSDDRGAPARVRARSGAHGA